jgi:hypothetical protein
MQEEIKKENSSGIVRLEGDIVFWDYNNKNILQIDLNEIVVIGEYTNADGPYFDDWFITFVTKEGKWQSIPWYADNIDALTQYLNNKFQQDFTVTYLAGSTEFNSIVHYPLHLKEKTLFAVTPSATYKEPKTLLDKILFSIGLGNFNTTKNINLTEAVQNELKNVSR